MSKEAVALLRGAGYIIKQKLGKQKYIPVFRADSSSARLRRKRDKLITKLIAECYDDVQITKKIKRHEDLTKLALKVQDILRHQEYKQVTKKDALRRIIANLLVDGNYRESVEKVLKTNKDMQWPEYRPVCRARRIKDPEVVIKTIFENLDNSWNPERRRYFKNKAGIKFQKAVADLLSKDWLTNYCLLAGYVPVTKKRKLGVVGKAIGETCGCWTVDRFALRKSSLKKVYREAKNYRYHTMKRTLNRSGQKFVVKLHHRRTSEKSLAVCPKTPKPGIWTRVFRGTSFQLAREKGIATPGATASQPQLPTASVSNLENLSEKAFVQRDLKEMSSPYLTNNDAHDVAVKAFVLSPGLPHKMLPARVLTYIELTAILDHPNVMRFIESFATDSEIFVIMTYATNRSLHHIIRNYGRLMEGTARVWTFQIAMAIQYLHSAGIIHRNVKCSNILISKGYDAVLSGFGSAKIKWLDLQHLQDSESCNYHACYRPYRPPEVLRRRPYALPPIDVWSLGIVLFRMLNNCFPYCYHNKDLMYKQQHLKKWKKNWRRKSEVSNDCLNLLKKMLDPDPAKRLKIGGVVNHRWFVNLSIPKSHRKAVAKAAFLFLPKEPPTEETSSNLIHKQASHKDVVANLDELFTFLEKYTEPDKERKFTTLEMHEGYKECYAKNKLNQSMLLKKIDETLRRVIPKIKRPPPPLQYEPYVSDQEEKEILEKTDAGIHQLKKRPEQAWKFLVHPDVDEGLKMSLAEVVKNVKMKTDELQELENEFTKKCELYSFKREDSELRSILTTKPTKSGTSVLGTMSAGYGHVPSTGTILARPVSKDAISLQQLRTSNFQLSSPTIALRTGDLPKLDFAARYGSTHSFQLNRAESKPTTPRHLIIKEERKEVGNKPDPRKENVEE